MDAATKFCPLSLILPFLSLLCGLCGFLAAAGGLWPAVCGLFADKHASEGCLPSFHVGSAAGSPEVKATAVLTGAEHLDPIQLEAETCVCMHLSSPGWPPYEPYHAGHEETC